MALSKIDVANMLTGEVPNANVAKLPASKLEDDINFRNIIINGSMDLAQRGTSASSVTSASYNTVDRWQNYISSLGTWTVSQDTTVPTGQGFAKSLKYDCTTADASPSASDVNILIQKFEGQNLQYLKKGTSSAESLTLSFWVRSNKTGTYTCEIYDGDNTRYIGKTYSISSADTWEKKTITFDGDTTGTLDNDNASSLNVHFWLGAGSDFTGGTFNNGTWGAGGNNTRVSSSQVNLADSTSNEWYITGVQLEAGQTSSDFEFLPVDVNLARCQRYYNLLVSGAGSPICIGSMYSSSALHGVIDLPTSMRVRPSIDQVTGTGYYTVYRGGGSDSFNSLVINFSGTGTENIINFVNETDISGTAGQAGLIVTANSASYFAVDAEL
ncbi:hypothetical protein N9003_01125 [bacterium]|nr:hypothetical protein [bacterium]